MNIYAKAYYYDDIFIPKYTLCYYKLEKIGGSYIWQPIFGEYPDIAINLIWANHYRTYHHQKCPAPLPFRKAHLTSFRLPIVLFEMALTSLLIFALICTMILSIPFIGFYFLIKLLAGVCLKCTKSFLTRYLRPMLARLHQKIKVIE